MKTLRKLKHKARHFSPNSQYKKPALFVAGFAVVGLVTAFVTFAATPTAHFEAESGSRTANSSVVSDATASGGQAVQFGSGHGGHVPDNCTPGPGVLGSMGPCIDMAYITPAVVGASTELFDTCLAVPNPATYCSAGAGEQSAFRTQCRYSHMNKDDPVLFINNPGAAHLHTFYGNTGTNAYSTSQTLLDSGNSTCRGGTFNRSAYWVPTMVDKNTGRPLSMLNRNTTYPDLEAYYKLGYQGVAASDTRPFPVGIQMIAGYLPTATTEAPLGIMKDNPVVYYCDGQDGNGNRVLGPQLRRIPQCPVGHSLTMQIFFPQCWDGVNLTSANGRSHMTYGNSNPVVGPLGCPPSHPIAFPFVEMLVRYEIKAGENSANWRLSSDKYTGENNGGYSGHADYIFGWKESAFTTVIPRCHQARMDCHYQLGDGRCPVFVTGRNECGSQ